MKVPSPLCKQSHTWCDSIKSLKRLATVLSLLAVTVAPTFAADAMDQPSSSVKQRALHFLSVGEVSAAVTLAPPPLPGSAEQAADLDEVHAVYHAATSNDIAVAYSQKKFNIFTFAPAIGGSFKPGKYPETEAFFHKVQEDAKTVTDTGKVFFKRPRPYVTDPSLANGKLEHSFSYPSGHSTESMVLALVLADLFPDHQDAIIATARNIGWHRVEIARHYPTDIYAGRVLARAIVRAMKKNPEFQQEFAAAKAEIVAAHAAEQPVMAK